jgi:hypothetical protein
MSVQIAALDVFDLHQHPAPNLRGKPLKSAAKKLLVEECHRGDSCYEFVTDKYKVKHYALRKYYIRTSRGLPMFETGGRPTKLDNESVEFIMNYLAEEEGNEKYVHSLIRREMRRTLDRRYPLGIPKTVPVSISKATVYRWSIKLISRHNHMVIENN